MIVYVSDELISDDEDFFNLLVVKMITIVVYMATVLVIPLIMHWLIFLVMF